MIWPNAIGRALLGVFFLSLIADASAAQTPASWSCAPTQAHCRSIFIVDSTWHTAIVLRREDLSGVALPELVDFPAARFIEFSWGDKDYFPDPNAGVLTAIKAAFWSSGSVLHLVGFRDKLETSYHGAKIIELRLSAPAYARLVEYIARSFARPSADGRTPASPGLVADSRFYPSNENFSLTNTCNTWVAAALQFAGLPVSPGLVLTAAQLSEQLDEITGSP